jgi:serine/threonine protein kinase
MHYTDDQLCAMLEDVDVDADLSNSDVTHLEQCEACRSRLASLSGEGAWLEDWMDSVGGVTCDEINTVNARSGSNSVVIKVDASDEMSSHLQCDSVRLDFLDAAIHPELLGRLGRYDIERLIGMGGYGIVFKARDSELNRVVAIKVLAPHLMNSGPARQRFAREAQASAAVVHDHVVPIYDVVADSKTCYFVMQYIAGESLQERVDRRGPLPTDDILRISAQTAAGLHAAHQQGLIHRDVKPGNVLLEDSVNRVMISDFGLARAADDASLTRSGTITGTPHYMSPEQARGEAIDARSDLFSLGSVIYFMCTGRSPFRADQMMAVLNRICHEKYRPIEETNTNVPYELTKIVDRLLCKNPDGRFSSAEEVGGDLQQLLSDFQSGKLRPRRWKTPEILRTNRRLAIAGLLLVAVTVFIAMAMSGFNGWFADGPLADSGGLQRLETEWSLKSGSPSEPRALTEVPFSSPKEMAPMDLSPSDTRLELEVFGKELTSAAMAIGSLERASQSFEALDGAGAGWDRDLFAIHAMLARLEAELAEDELQHRDDLSGRDIEIK